jgi:asparagine synthase (glutamine-hydrolysing)
MRRMAAGSVDGLLAGATALHRMIPAAHRPGMLTNKLKQATAIVRAGGGISELYAQLYATTAGEPPVLGIGDEHAMRWQAIAHRNVVSDPIDRMGYFALLGCFVDGTLAKVDRASMAQSLEVRVPMLDHRVVEYAWRLPPALKCSNQFGSKPLLRRLLYRYVPRELVDRPKKGFGSPLPVWLRGPLRGWAEELLDERSLREEGLFDSKAIRGYWNEHLAAANDHSQLLWNVLMFRQWRGYWEADRGSGAAAAQPSANALNGLGLASGM